MAYTGVSITDYLKSIGQPSDYTSRATLARRKGIANYTGTTSQNTQLLNILRVPTTAPAPAPALISTSAPASKPAVTAPTPVPVNKYEFSRQMAAMPAPTPTTQPQLSAGAYPGEDFGVPIAQKAAYEAAGWKTRPHTSGLHTIIIGSSKPATTAPVNKYEFSRQMAAMPASIPTQPPTTPTINQ